MTRTRDPIITKVGIGHRVSYIFQWYPAGRVGVSWGVPNQTQTATNHGRWATKSTADSSTVVALAAPVQTQAWRGAVSPH